jgi:hypothetical protein
MPIKATIVSSLNRDLIELSSDFISTAVASVPAKSAGLNRERC